MIHATILMNLKALCSVRKPVTKDYMLYDSIYMKCPESAKL